MKKLPDCKIDGCEKPGRKRGWCEMHYYRWRKNGDPLSTKHKPHDAQREGFTVDDFWSRVDQSGGPDACWPWKRARLSQGYGIYTVTGRGCFRAHRFAYTLAFGPIPKDKPHVLHRCDNPPCCNPSHLYAGTHRQNMQDRESRGRTARGETHWYAHQPERRPKGEHNPAAKLTADQVHTIRQRVNAGETRTSVARSYGMRPGHISKIVLRQIWQDVD